MTDLSTATILAALILVARSGVRYQTHDVRPRGPSCKAAPETTMLQR